MTEILKQRGRELVGDESGVAFALTVTVAIIIFLFGFAVYAVGETVRQRIELQNAADAAAYSGALVQADTISRVAVINKAMSWNYVMMTRRQMDYIVDRWLGAVRQQYHASYTAAAAFQMCSCIHHRNEMFDWWVGIGPGASHKKVLLNGHHQVHIMEIDAARSANAARNTAFQLEAVRRCVAAMNQEEKRLISGMKKRVENAVEFAVNADVSLTPNDDAVKDKRKIAWRLYDLKSASVYFEELKKDEQRFLGFGDFSGTPENVFGAGADTWLRQSGTSGFQRNYMQSGNTLIANWFTFNWIWVDTPTGCVPVSMITNPVPAVTGMMVRDKYFTGQVAKPQVLKDNFFKSDGAIVVGVSRPLNNPLAFIYGGGDKAGIYSAFEVGGGKQTMWCVAAARAGYRETGWKAGEYRNRGKIPAKKDNLKIADWDALFLPLDDKNTAGNGFLADLAKKLGVSRQFVGRDFRSSYSNIDFNSARAHLHH